MNPTLLPLYGSFGIQGYGLSLAIGLMLFWWLVERDPLRKTLMNSESLASFITFSILCIIIGGRIGDIVGDPENYRNWFDMIAIWQGGLSILGATITTAIGTAFFLYRHNIPLLSMYDLTTLHVPILHIFGRLGCFIAGCCYGTPLAAWWAITYTNPYSAAPLHIGLHPTQLYSAALFAVIGLILHLMRRYIKPPTGTIALCYLLLAGFERFIMDSFRGDRRMIGYFSFHQWLALGIISSAVLGLIFLWHKARARYGYF